MTLPIRSTGDMITASDFAALEAGINAATAQQDGSAMDSITHIGLGTNTPSTGIIQWMNIGNITVPAWAGRVYWTMNFTDMLQNTAAANTNFEVLIGNVPSSNQWKRLPNLTAVGRFQASYSDITVSPPAGLQTVQIMAQYSAGTVTSQYTSDAASYVSALFWFQP